MLNLNDLWSLRWSDLLIFNLLSELLDFFEFIRFDKMNIFDFLKTLATIEILADGVKQM